MNDIAVVGWRRAVRRGELPSDLVTVLREVALRLSRRRGLPPSFAPYGQWDDEAAEEIFAAWYTDRLVGDGQLLALLDRSSSEAGLRALAERSLRQHLLNAADRSQARNLFARVVALLRDNPRFTLVQQASRVADTWYALAKPAGERLEAELWSKPDRLLVAEAWGVGDLTIIRYRPGAAKLSPVLDTGELQRFVEALMARSAAALTPGLIMIALSARLNLGAPQMQDVDESAVPAATKPGPDAEVALVETARMIAAGLTARQRDVLRRGDDTVASIAEALHCSVGTVINEQRRIAVAVSRVSENDEERDVLLNITADLLYPSDDA